MYVAQALNFSEGHYNSTVGSSGDSSGFVTLVYQHGYTDRR